MDLTQFCNCYKVANLSQAILGSTRVSNLKDKYILGEQLGLGQFGVIRKCTDTLTGEVLACKSISKDRLVTSEDARSVELEIEIMTKLSSHPNVVNLKAVYEEESYVHLLMELCAGGELFHCLEKQGRFSEDKARVFFKQLMEVVEFCHENGVVHRDLKPENILLATDSSSSPIKLADFGLATYCKPGQKLSGTVGSPFYIAPEVLSGGYSQAADVWSAGVILYILLSGMPPFWGKTKSTIFDAVRASDLRFPPNPWDRVSGPAKDLINAMLCVDPSKRLTARSVLAHSWVNDSTIESQEILNHHHEKCNELETGPGSFSSPFMARIEDYSFESGDTKPRQSPTFTCKSSFSSFLVEDDVTQCSISGRFSFSSPISSMPSFTFFSPTATSDLTQGNVSLTFVANESSIGLIYSESSDEKLFSQPDFSLPVKLDFGETERKENRRVYNNGGTKRNHTIGFGEFNQLDLIVTESVIRWASCTDIPTSSLRLSIVC